MIKKKINYKLHNNLKTIIQEYMNLNDGTSQRDHTIQDLWNWIAYTKEGYVDLDKDKVRKLHEEKKEYYGLLQYTQGGWDVKDFWSNVKVIDKKIENEISGYEYLKKFNTKKDLLNN